MRYYKIKCVARTGPDFSGPHEFCCYKTSIGKPDKRPVHVAEIKKSYKGKVHVSTCFRRTFREGGRVRHETVANISDLPDDLLAVIRTWLASKQSLVGDGGTWTIERSLPHGNVAAVLGTLRNIGLDQVIGARQSDRR